MGGISKDQQQKMDKINNQIQNARKLNGKETEKITRNFFLWRAIIEPWEKEEEGAKKKNNKKKAIWWNGALRTNYDYSMYPL